jgi:hypothetical protein
MKRLTPGQKRAAWIGGLALAGVGVALVLEKQAKAATSSGANPGTIPGPGPNGDLGGGTGNVPTNGTGSGTTTPTVTPISSNPATGPNGCTWRTPTSAPNDVYTLAGNISNGTGPIAWQEGMSYGPLTMSDGNAWRLNMATGITSTTAPVHDVQAQVCT